ncbi:MAG: class I tRNA ligase family protein, partial [Deltaproteobacteria bacterium]|nr:class I tRNA ligase family protein [Deltaproteobacteria bacterium]
KTRHPLFPGKSVLLPARHVTLDQGTGLVHTAPGHGREDYELGLANNLEIFSPLDDEARFTDAVPGLAGTKVLEANGTVIELLKEKGAILGVEKLSHQYPHCWRCKKPVVFRATPQWFISMEEGDLRKKSLEAIDSVKWIPARGRERIRGMVENRPDWCVSRQRTWGVPITIFFCETCGEWFYSRELRDRLFELFREKGADVWFEADAKDLLPPGQTCPRCGGDRFKKETDILDVWFDSGASFAAVTEDRDYLPDLADMYLEGSDQHRGWFHSSLLLSVANRGRAPYREVVTHGYVVDGNGKKMSKSLGNTIEPGEIIKKHGADILRLWVASENYRDDVRVSGTIMDMLVKAYFNFRNTARFILGNLGDFDPDRDRVPVGDIADPFDLHALDALAATVKAVKASYDEYAFHDVYHGMNNHFGNLSSFYLDILKDRLYTFKASDPARRSSQTVIWTILSAATRLMAPILSFTAEEIWSHLPETSPKPESVFLAPFPEADPLWENPKLRGEMESLTAIRSLANKALEEARRAKTIGSSLDAKLLVEARGDALELLRKREKLLPELFIVSKVELAEGGKASPEEPVVITVGECEDPKCPRCWNRRPEVPRDGSGVCDKCRKALS